MSDFNELLTDAQDAVTRLDAECNEMEYALIPSVKAVKPIDTASLLFEAFRPLSKEWNDYIHGRTNIKPNRPAFTNPLTYQDIGESI